MPTFPDRKLDVSPVQAARLLRAFGARGWQIARHEDLAYWSAEKTSTDQHHVRYLTAHSAGELADLIEAAEAGTGAQARELPGGGRFQRLQALEDALKFRRARVTEPCAECDTAPGGRCEDHARDLDLIGEYEQAARRLGAGQDCQPPVAARS